MTNNELIQKRWKYTDARLKVYKKEIDSIFSDIQDEVLELYKELDIDRDNLNANISPSTKRKLERLKKQWKEENILTPYLEFLLNTLKLTNSNVIKIFVLAIYLKYQQKQLKESKEAFVDIANDVFKQAKEESNKEPYIEEDLTWSIIRDWTIVHTINVTFEEYLNVLSQTASEEMAKLIINSIYQGVELDEKTLQTLIDKQSNRIISIKNDRYSGVSENIARQVGNKAYIEPFSNDLCKFVAEVDDRTTKMCLSMNDYIFNTKDTNIFYRYSAEKDAMMRYEIDGLVQGINLPPITDHFHWCRSTITYQINLSNDELQRLIFGQDKTKVYKKSKDLKLEKSYNASVNFANESTSFDGKTYSNKDIKPNSNRAGEEENAYWLRDTFNMDVEIIPEIKKDNIMNYDYKLDSSNERWDLKANITGSSRRLVKNNVHYEQATSYIFDMSKTGLTVEEFEDRINYAFITEKWLNTIILKDNDKLIGVYTNLYK